MLDIQLHSGYIFVKNAFEMIATIVVTIIMFLLSASIVVGFCYLVANLFSLKGLEGTAIVFLLLCFCYPHFKGVRAQ